MSRTLDEIIASLPVSERAKIDERARELVAQEMSLQDRRKAIGKTQTAVAASALRRSRELGFGL